MGQTRMFRDRVVSMEQTLEGGEKHLPLLQEICREALGDFAFREHAFDHERDLFVMELEGPGGQRKRVCWTRMVLFDAERIPTLTGDPAAALRGKIVDYLRARANRSEIVVTFRHLEDGWVDTPEPRREVRRRRRGGRGGRGGEQKRGPAPERRPALPEKGRGAGTPAGGGAPRGSVPRPGPGPERQPPAAPGAPGAAGGAGGRRRRRFRKRRRGRGPGGPSGPPPPAAPP